MKPKICQKKDLFDTQTLNYTEMDLIYEHQKNDASNI